MNSIEDLVDPKNGIFEKNLESEKNKLSKVHLK